jgi:PAS domain S-box-containing protein
MWIAIDEILVTLADEPKKWRGQAAGKTLLDQCFGGAKTPKMASSLKLETAGRFPSGILKSAVTVGSVVASVLATKVLQHFRPSEPLASVFLCAIMFSAWFGGFRQGLLAIALSLLAFNYCFLPLILSGAVNWIEVPRNTLFVLCALWIVFLAAAQKNNAESLRRARDDLAVKVQDLKQINESLDAENAQRKLAEGALRRSKAYLAEAQRLSCTGSFGWRVSTGELIWSEESFRIYQFDAQTKPTVELALQRVHPSDATFVKERVGRAATDGKDFDYEHRLLMPDGSVKHIRIVAHAERAESGELDFVGAVMDVTAAKEAEDKIRLIIDTVPGLLWTARPDGWVDFLNQRWLDYTGMTLEQGLGWAWQPSYHPDDIGTVLSKWRAAVAEGKPLDTEARLRRFDGEYRWHLKRAFPLKDRAGRVLGWYGGNIDIHDVKQAEEKLRQNESFLSEAQRLSHTGSWAWKVKTKENLFWSKEHYRIYGFDPDREGGQFAAARERIHPDDARSFDQALERAIQERSDFETHHRIVLPGGEVKQLQVLGHPVFDDSGEVIEYIGTVMDVTERKLSEALLSSEKRLLEMIAGGVPLPAVLNELCSTIDEQSPGLRSAVLVLDADGQRLWPVAGPGIPEEWIRTVSPLAIGPCAGSCGTAAYRKEPIVVSDIATDPLWEDFREAALSYGLKACSSKPMMSTKGSVLGTFATYYGEIWNPDERDLLLIERATHIAQIAIERDRAQDSLRKAQANLAHATRVTMMGELTASIAHEVNQPLAAIVNNANACVSLLPDGASGLEEVREALAEIIEDADRASDVIARIRQLAKRAPMEKSLLNPGDVVKDVLALARYESGTRGITIRTDLAGDLPSVSGDRVQLQQVLLNLVINGMDAMSTVEESKRVLTICGRRGMRGGLLEACLGVQDSGAGIKLNEINRLFEAFYTTKPQGMGMGLAISRSIVEAHGGRMWVEPNQGPGATFLFSLPSAGDATS